MSLDCSHIRDYFPASKAVFCLACGLVKSEKEAIEEGLKPKIVGFRPD